MTNGKRTAIWFWMAALAAPVACAGRERERCRFRVVRELTAPAAEILRVRSGPGPVEIAGEPGRSEIRVEATLCASDQELLDGLAVSFEGGSLETTYPDRVNHRSYASIGLKVRTASETGIELEDGSGSVVISEVGPVVVHDGSGSLILRRTGPIQLEDGSGSLRIEDAGGDARVEDGSGSVRIEGVQGDVHLEDRSGSLAVSGVTGSVIVGDDSSGSIRIEDVGGSVRIGNPGSGGVSIEDVEGDLTVEQGRRRRIRYSGIAGTVELPPERRRR